MTHETFPPFGGQRVIERITPAPKVSVKWREEYFRLIMMPLTARSEPEVV